MACLIADSLKSSAGNVAARELGALPVAVLAPAPA